MLRQAQHERGRHGRRFGLGHVAKRWLYLTHRWLGIASCLLFAMWFVSGLVMIYVPFPALTRAERLAGLPPLVFIDVRAQPATFAGAAETLTLEMRGARAVWRVRDWDGAERTIAAATGVPLGPVGAAEAAPIATAFGHAPLSRLELIVRDQWTVAGGYDAHRPLWKATLSGSGGRVLYVSSRTGAVVLDTDARERFWNWLGSVPHWIYPTVLRQDNAAWRQVVMWVSGPCIVGAVAGLWIGLLRVRLGRRRFTSNRTIPYHGWMAWHHVAGLFGGLALLAWIFSGWLSVDPFRLFASHPVGRVERRAYAAPGMWPTLDLSALARRATGARAIEFRWLDGRLFAEPAWADGRTIVLDARTLAPVTPATPDLVGAARRLRPGMALAAVERLTEPDEYWTGPLPVLRLRFADAGATWVYLDPRDGRFLGDLDRRRRVYRWAFDFLHKWDLGPLIRRRPLWDALLWLLSALGLVTSVSGVWIGWRRLVRRRGTAAASRALSVTNEQAGAGSMAIGRLFIAVLGGTMLLGGCGHDNKAADRAADEVAASHANAAEAIDNRADALENRADNLHEEAKDLRKWGEDKAHVIRKAGRDGVQPDKATMNEM